MAEPLVNPHDRFFKEVFSHQETARDFLQRYLPSQVATLLDFSTLQINKDTFIDPDLQEHFSDLLYQVARQDGQDTFIYILFEHKSYPDPLTPFQLLKYLVKIWEQAHKQGQPLQPIIPLVVYHGRSRWTIATQFSGLFDLPEALRPYMPEYRYEVYDLTAYTDEQIQGEITLRVTLLLLKYIFRDDFGQRLADILGLLKALSERRTGLEYLETVLRYIAGSTERVSEAELQRVVSEVIEEGGELMPTLVEQWLERGRQEGLERGREEGLEEGRREAALTMLQQFLTRRFKEIPKSLIDALHGLDLAAILKLSETAFEAESLAEVEAALVRLKSANGHSSGRSNDD